jgi:hypothetical protein
MLRPDQAITGITVDRDGNLRIILSWCGRDPNVAQIYHFVERPRSVTEDVESTLTCDGDDAIVFDAR